MICEDTYIAYQERDSDLQKYYCFRRRPKDITLDLSKNLQFYRL